MEEVRPCAPYRSDHTCRHAGVDVMGAADVLERYPDLSQLPVEARRVGSIDVQPEETCIDAAFPQGGQEPSRWRSEPLTPVILWMCVTFTAARACCGRASRRSPPSPARRTGDGRRRPRPRSSRRPSAGPASSSRRPARALTSPTGARNPVSPSRTTVRRPARPRRDDRTPGRERLDRHDRGALVLRGEEERVEDAVPRPARPGGSRGSGTGRRPRARRRASRPTPAPRRRPRHEVGVGPACDELRKHPHEVVGPLDRRQPADPADHECVDRHIDRGATIKRAPRSPPAAARRGRSRRGSLRSSSRARRRGVRGRPVPPRSLPRSRSCGGRAAALPG